MPVLLALATAFAVSRKLQRSLVSPMIAHDNAVALLFLLLTS